MYKGLFILFITLFSVYCKRYGVDISQPCSQNAFTEMRTKNGVEFVIVRCWRSLDTTDPNCAASVRAAHSAGMAVGVYFFPCPYNCRKTPQQQVGEFYQYIKNNNLEGMIGEVWFDVEGEQYWSPDKSQNLAIYNDFLKNLLQQGYKQFTVGVYCSHYQWNRIFESSAKNAYSWMPLWWCRYDGHDSLFYNWQDFGGWTKDSNVVIKQYRGSSVLQSCGVDLNVMA
ncbi:hypothetical protein PCE1_003760 [Barthelona sp. PCE]